MRTPAARRSIGDDGIICCTVGSRQFAFRGGDVRHVARGEALRADAAADGRVGVLRIGGQSVPVFALGRALGDAAPAVRHADQHIAVTGEPGALAGWLVDRIARTTIPDAAAVMPLPDIIGAPATSWFDALVNLGDTSVLLLAPQHLHPLADRPPDREAPGRSQEPAGSSQASPGLSRGLSAQGEPLVVLFSTAALPRSDARRYALSARQIAAIVQPLPLITVPGSAAYVTGVSCWRDAVVPVIDFRDPVDRDPAPHARCLLAQCDGRLRGTIVAVPIESEVAVHKPAATDRRLDTTSCPPFAAGMFTVGGDTVALLDLNALFVAPHWSPRTNNPESDTGTTCTLSTMRTPRVTADC